MIGRHQSLVVSLAQMSCPKVFIAIVLLIIWSCDTSTKYELVELFAGKGFVGREWRSAGRAVGQFDWDYCPAGMNFTGNGGFATAIQMILCLMPMGLVLMGPDCSSWTVISRGTSWRPPHNFWGNLTLPWIQQANLMISRLTLTMMLTVALGCKFLCEQPSGTEPVFARHHRFEEFCNMCCFVFKQRFWMQLHGAPSPKPTSMWSNDDYILDGLDLGPLRKSEREAKTTVETTRKYKDAQGKDRFQGTEALRTTQAYPPALGRALLQLHDDAKCKPQFDLRQKQQVDPMSTDLQIFQGLSQEDCWVDASLPQVFLYLYQNPALKIPNEWEAVMRTMQSDMKKYVVTEEDIIALRDS